MEGAEDDDEKEEGRQRSRQRLTEADEEKDVEACGGQQQRGAGAEGDDAVKGRV